MRTSPEFHFIEPKTIVGDIQPQRFPGCAAGRRTLGFGM